MSRKAKTPRLVKKGSFKILAKVPPKSRFVSVFDKRGKERGGATMRCPVCDARTLVYRVRRDTAGTVVRTRRCIRKGCAEEFTTTETRTSREA